MTKKPSYRFAGYTEPWEEKKLGEVTSDLKSGLSRMLANEDIGIPVIRANNINDGYLDLSNDIKYWYEVDPQGSNTNNYVVEENDILINFINSEAKMGTSAIVRFPLDRKTIYTTNILRLRVSEGISSNFIFYIFSISRYINFIKSITKPAVNQSSFTTVDFKKFIIFLPSLPEQTAIGSFFQDIDQLISLQQSKLEVLKEQKKTYLKLLFPAKGQTKPALRFAGFEDDWKEVKLGGIGEIQTGNTPPTNEEDNYEKNGFPWVTPTDINSLVLQTTSKQLSEVGKSKARIAKSGSILVTCIASIGKNTLVRTDSAFNQQINSLTPSEKYSSYFLLTQSEIWSRYMLSVAGAGTMQIINKSDFSNIKTMVPTLPEQQAIGSFFQDLDKAIAKQEEKVNQLKESKQTLLRKMFI
ncbi:restriction endonuclease subunit S [Streptococcus pseudopneumoniae]|uniref:restriction endonuclease subunit S n=1 Tax=Streptococcus pseudopneumoniae TaxID=257758 RepID=UPI0020791073|nr:restriction endonuclease subunit S [Streptococcus pseudopneumoniae]